MQFISKLQKVIN